jgi:hypothetical protein
MPALELGGSSFPHGQAGTARGSQHGLMAAACRPDQDRFSINIMY